MIQNGENIEIGNTQPLSLLNNEQQRPKSAYVLSRESSACRAIGYPSLY